MKTKWIMYKYEPKYDVGAHCRGDCKSLIMVRGDHFYGAMWTGGRLRKNLIRLCVKCYEKQQRESKQQEGDSKSGGDGGGESTQKASSTPSKCSTNSSSGNETGKAWSSGGSGAGPNYKQADFEGREAKKRGRTRPTCDGHKECEHDCRKCELWTGNTKMKGGKYEARA